MSQDASPVLSFSGPFFCNIDYGQVKGFQKRFLGRVGSFCLGDLPQAAVEIFDGIRCVDDFTDLSRILEKGVQFDPVVSPGLDRSRIFASPFFIDPVEFVQSLLFCHGCINCFQIAGKLFHVFPYDITDTAPDLVDDTALDIGLRVDRADSFAKS